MRLSSGIALILVATLLGGALWGLTRGRSVRAKPALSEHAFSGGLEFPSNPTAGPLWDSAVELARSGSLDAAARLFAEGASQAPRDAAWPQAEAECWAAAGRHDSALSALERCRSIAPLSTAALLRRRASRLELGFSMASTGQPWKGRQLGEAILQESPGDSEATLLVGYSQAMNGNPGSAEAVLEKLVGEHPGVVQAYPILVQCAMRRGDAEAAARWLERYAQADPAAIGLAAMDQQLQRMRSRAEGRSNSRLRVVCMGTCPYGLEDEVMASAETAWNLLKSQIGSEPPHQVNILLGGEANAPHWAAASFDGQVHLPLEPATDPGRRDAVLRHELTHAFLAFAGGGQVPLWLNEGLAQYYQGERCDRLPGAESAEWLDEIQARRTFMDLDEDQAELAYIFSLAVAQELMELNTSTALAKYLAHLRKGVDERVAFRKVFGDDYPHLSARIRARL